MALYKISDICFKIDCYRNDYFVKQLKNYITNDKPDVIIEFKHECDFIDMPQGNLIANVNQSYYIREADGSLVVADHLPEITDGAINLVRYSKDYKKIDVYLCKKSYLDIELDIRPFVIFGEIFKNVLLQNDGSVIHSSAISYKNNGILFSAPPGTGKSTHTQLWVENYPETVIVNDDMPAIREIDGKMYVFGTPWSGKSNINNNVCVPLRAIVLLSRGTSNFIETASRDETIFNLVNETVKSAVFDTAQNNLKFIKRIVESVPVYSLKCNVSADAVEKVKNQLNLL